MFIVILNVLKKMLYKIHLINSLRKYFKFIKFEYFFLLFYNGWVCTAQCHPESSVPFVKMTGQFLNLRETPHCRSGRHPPLISPRKPVISSDSEISPLE